MLRRIAKTKITKMMWWNFRWIHYPSKIEQSVDPLRIWWWKTSYLLLYLCIILLLFAHALWNIIFMLDIGQKGDLFLFYGWRFHSLEEHKASMYSPLKRLGLASLVLCGVSANKLKISIQHFWKSFAFYLFIAKAKLVKEALVILFLWTEFF